MDNTGAYRTKGKQRTWLQIVQTTDSSIYYFEVYFTLKLSRWTPSTAASWYVLMFSVLQTMMRSFLTSNIERYGALDSYQRVSYYAEYMIYTDR